MSLDISGLMTSANCGTFGSIQLYEQRITLISLPSCLKIFICYSEDFCSIELTDLKTVYVW